MVDDRGIGFSAKIKPNALDKLNKKKEEEAKKVKYDPAWG